MIPKHKIEPLVMICLLGLLLLSSCQVWNNTGQDPIAPSENVKISVKFSEGTDIRLREGKLVSLAEGTIPELVNLFESYTVINIERGFSQPEEEIENEREQLIEEGSTDVPDLNLHFVLTVANIKTATELINELNRLDIVELAELAPEPAPPPGDLP